MAVGSSWPHQFESRSRGTNLPLLHTLSQLRKTMFVCVCFISRDHHHGQTRNIKRIGDTDRYPLYFTGGCSTKTRLLSQFFLVALTSIVVARFSLHSISILDQTLARRERERERTTKLNCLSLLATLIEFACQENLKRNKIEHSVHPPSFVIVSLSGWCCSLSPLQHHTHTHTTGSSLTWPTRTTLDGYTEINYHRQLEWKKNMRGDKNTMIEVIHIRGRRDTSVTSEPIGLEKVEQTHTPFDWSQCFSLAPKHL